MEKTNIERCFITSPLYSNDIHHSPQWTTDSTICYPSSFHLQIYSLDDEITTTIPRHPLEPPVLAALFQIDPHSLNSQAYYVGRKFHQHYLYGKPDYRFSEALLHSDTPTLMLSSIHDILMLSGQLHCLAVVQIKSEDNFSFGLLLVDLQKCQLTKHCTVMSLQSKRQHSQNDVRVLFKLGQRILKVLPTRRPNIFSLLTPNMVYLLEVDYEIMGIRILSKYELQNGLQIGYSCLNDQDYIVVLAKQTGTFFTLLSITGGSIEMHHIFEDKSISESFGGFTLNENVLIAWENGSQLLHDFMIVQEKTLTLKYSSHFKLCVDAPINQVILSPHNANALISTQCHKGIKKWHILQYDLYCQLPSFEVDVKLIKNIYSSQCVSHLRQSRVQTGLFALSGGLLHTLQNQILHGAMSFDVHPYGYMLAVSFGFAVKIYTADGAGFCSIYTINLPQVKKIIFNPFGSEICLITSRSVKLFAAYSFQFRSSISQKCTFYVDGSYSRNSNLLVLLTDTSIVVHSTQQYFQIELYRIDLTLEPLLMKTLQGSGNRTNQKKVMPLQVKVAGNQQVLVVLPSGGLLVQNRNSSFSEIHRYGDNQAISVIELEEENGVLFVGCYSGKMRTHIWPLTNKINSFDVYSETRVGSDRVTSLSVSILENIIYVGTVSGSISMLRFNAEEDSQRLNLKNVMRGEQLAQSCPAENRKDRLYPFVLGSNRKMLEDPRQKIKLEYKLVEVIQKLKDQLQQRKDQMNRQFKQYTRETNEIGNDLVAHRDDHTEKLRLFEQTRVCKEENQKEIQRINQECNAEMLNIIEKKSNMIKCKEDFKLEAVRQINSLKAEFSKEICEFQREKMSHGSSVSSLENKMRVQVDSTQEWNWPYVDIRPELEKDKQELARSLEDQQARNAQLRKQSSYLETAITSMTQQSIKQEAMQYKIHLQLANLKQILTRQQGITEGLGQEIKQAERKLNSMDLVSSKQNASNWKTSFVHQNANDACSYKLWIKGKIEGQLQNRIDYLRRLNQLADQKSDQIVDIVMSNQSMNHMSKQFYCSASDKMGYLKQKKLRASHTSRLIHRTVEQSNQNSPIRKKTENRRIKLLSNLNSNMESSSKLLKTTMKTHQYKMDRFSNENSQLLCEYERLKEQNQRLAGKQRQKMGQILQLQAELGDKGVKLTFSKPLAKTNYQKYVQKKSERLPIKHRKVEGACKTAVCSPLLSSSMVRF